MEPAPIKPTPAITWAPSREISVLAVKNALVKIKDTKLHHFGYVEIKTAAAKGNAVRIGLPSGKTHSKL